MYPEIFGFRRWEYPGQYLYNADIPCKCDARKVGFVCLSCDTTVHYSGCSQAKPRVIWHRSNYGRTPSMIYICGDCA